MRGLYVHVPFCIKKCHYCNFVISVDAPRAKHDAYFVALEKEADEALHRRGPLHFSTFYLGGGTPSALEPEEMRRLFSIMQSRFTFDADAEITCEINPGEVDEAKLEAYRDLGVNRISLGAQSFNDALLIDMNRAHGARDIEKTLKLVKQLGFSNVSMDFILRLPNQNLCDVIESLERAASLDIQQVVLYDLTIHDGTVYGMRARKGILQLPNEDLHEKMALQAEKILTESGFEHYELSSFAKPGFESRHNLIYWQNADYLGLGPGAFSYLDKTRYQYASTVERYLDKTTRAEWSNDDEETMAGQRLEMETLLTGLRLKGGVELSRFGTLAEHLESEIPSLEAAGLVERRDGRLFLTHRGRRVPESVFTNLSLPSFG